MEKRCDVYLLAYAEAKSGSKHLSQSDAICHPFSVALASYHASNNIPPVSMAELEDAFKSSGVKIDVHDAY